MFGFVGQSSKMDNKDIYDSYITIMPPLRRSAEVLLKTLEFFGWSHVALIGGGLDSNTWDKVDALWKTVEDPLRDKFKLTAAVKFDTSNPQLVHQNVRYISKVARGKRRLSAQTVKLCLFMLPALSHSPFLYCCLLNLSLVLLEVSLCFKGVLPPHHHLLLPLSVFRPQILEDFYTEIKSTLFWSAC